MYCYIDFEFNKVTNPKLNLVCAVLTIPEKNIRRNHWLDSEDSRELLKRDILHLREKGYTFVAWNVISEARSFISLGIDPVKCLWIDLYLEYRMLTNHWDEYMYGPQLIDGRKVTTSRPKSKYEQTEEERKKTNSSKPKHNLLAATYKLLGVVKDSAHKNKMRDLIISNPPMFSEDEKTSILDYCYEDVELLPDLHKAIDKAYIRSGLNKVYIKNELEDDQHERAEYAARSAIMETKGYPIDTKATQRFIDNVPNILKSLAEDINSQNVPIKPFKWNKKDQKYSMKQKVLQDDWIAHLPQAKRWMKTDTGKYSLSLEAISRFFNFTHDYPRDNLGAQLVRYFKTRQSLNGFLPKPKKSKKKSFHDYVGEDGRVRSYMGIFGSQSSRSQPAATGFIPLKAAWMRRFILAPPGKAICGIDYGSQEFLISALVSKDENMVEAYRSGDVYLHFAKLAGAVPLEGTKKEYAKERDLFKSTTLGISYNMGAESLAVKLTNDTGIPQTEADAQKLIQKFQKAYPKFKDWNQDNLLEYIKNNYMALPDKWILWGDQDNWRSCNNFPIQGRGATIMRKAVAYAQDEGLDVIYTLHDALYIEYDSDDLRAVDTLARSMRRAFVDTFDGDPDADLIRLDANIWGRNYTDGKVITPEGMEVKQQKYYIDGRAINDYERFKKYFEEE